MMILNKAQNILAFEKPKGARFHYQIASCRYEGGNKRDLDSIGWLAMLTKTILNTMFHLNCCLQCYVLRTKQRSTTSLCLHKDRRIIMQIMQNRNQLSGA